MNYPQPFWLSFTCAAMILAIGNSDNFWWNAAIQIFAILALVEINRGYLKIIKDNEAGKSKSSENQ